MNADDGVSDESNTEHKLGHKFLRVECVGGGESYPVSEGGGLRVLKYCFAELRLVLL